jgi:IS30 family transposase
MQGYAELVLGPDLYLEKFLDKDFIGRRQLWM